MTIEILILFIKFQSTQFTNITKIFGFLRNFFAFEAYRFERIDQNSKKYVYENYIDQDEYENVVEESNDPKNSVFDAKRRFHDDISNTSGASYSEVKNYKKTLAHCRTHIFIGDIFISKMFRKMKICNKSENDIEHDETSKKNYELFHV